MTLSVNILGRSTTRISTGSEYYFSLWQAGRLGALIIATIYFLPIDFKDNPLFFLAVVLAAMIIGIYIETKIDSVQFLGSFLQPIGQLTMSQTSISATYYDKSRPGFSVPVEITTSIRLYSRQSLFGSLTIVFVVDNRADGKSYTCRFDLNSTYLKNRFFELREEWTASGVSVQDNDFRTFNAGV